MQEGKLSRQHCGSARLSWCLIDGPQLGLLLRGRMNPDSAYSSVALSDRYRAGSSFDGAICELHSAAGPRIKTTRGFSAFNFDSTVQLNNPD